MLANLRRGRIVQGASTITQQFVRGSVLDRSRTYGRKFREAWLAHRLEEKFGKQAILQAYLNHVYFGEGYYGVRGRIARLLRQARVRASMPPKAATLAALINRPSGWTMRQTPARIRDRRDWVLREMFAARLPGCRDVRRRRSRRRSPRRWRSERNARADRSGQRLPPGPYFASLVHEALFEQFGVERALTGGLRVYTTLDADVQNFAEDSVAKRLAELDKKRRKARRGPLQAALVAIEPSTGYVRALVGGRNFAESPFNRATDAKRQPGSAFKPFVFAAALEAGFSPGTTIDGLDGYRRIGAGRLSARRRARDRIDDLAIGAGAFEQSRRRPPAAARRSGRRRSIWPDRVGLDEMPAVPSLALGTGEVSLLNLTSAYTAFANGGVLQPPVIDPAHRRSGRPRDLSRPIGRAAAC